MLELSMLRLCEVKENLTKMSQHTEIKQSEFVNLQDVLIDLKKSPECLEIPVPRFFKETDYKVMEQRE